MKRHLGTLLVGVVAVVGIAYVGARAMTPSTDDVVLAQQDGQETPDGEQGRPEGARKHRPGVHRAIRGELVVPGEEEGTFNTVKIDRGVVERVDGAIVVIKEDDGTVVEVPTSDETRVARDGEEVEVSALQAGDHVFANRVDEGDGFVTRAVRAFSSERWAEMEQRREECRSDPRQCRADRRARRTQREDAAA
jgi:hypothetical protein